jgi:carboxyl-terminal processing protease
MLALWKLPGKFIVYPSLLAQAAKAKAAQDHHSQDARFLMLKPKLITGVALLSLPLLIAAVAIKQPVAAKAGVSEMRPTEDQAIAATFVYGVFSDSALAYRSRPLDDALSADIYKRYIETLDPEKMYFTASDMAEFAKYKTTLDDGIKTRHIEAPFAIFQTYQSRAKQRIAHARSLLNQPFDFSAKEVWAYDRKKASWADDANVLNDLWRKSVKNDALRLKLAGRSTEETRKTLDKRYAQQAQRLNELRGDDAFEFFMNAYTESIDPHSSYLSPRANEDFMTRMRLSLQGIGAVLQRQDDYVVIRTVVPGSPAERSGKVKVGDRVVGVGQGDKGPMIDVIGWRIDDVVDKIRGEKNTKVRLDMIPVDQGIDGKHQLVTIIRDTIKLEDQAASKRILDVQGKRIGVIELPAFYADFEAMQRRDPNARSATTDVAKLLNELKAEKVDGVMIDLRENGGGSLTEAVDLTGLFIDRGPVVQVRQSGGYTQVYSDENRGVLWNGPLAVLVNRSSASASEIFAAAIQDYGRGLVIGESTFGKGTVQGLLPLPPERGGGAGKYGTAKVTTQQFFRIDGGTTQNAAVVPDIQFPVTVDATEFGESMFENALPFTRIAPAKYTQVGNFSVIDKQLLAQHQQRVLKDVEFKWWREDVEEFRAERLKKTISLNETERHTERNRLEAKRKSRAAQRKALGLADAGPQHNDDGLQDNERDVREQVADEAAAKNRPDPLMRESANILADTILMLKANPALSAQVLVTKNSQSWAN